MSIYLSPQFFKKEAIPGEEKLIWKNVGKEKLTWELYAFTHFMSFYDKSKTTGYIYAEVYGKERQLEFNITHKSSETIVSFRSPYGTQLFYVICVRADNKFD